MSIYSTSVKRPVTTILIFVALMVMGIYSLTQLPVDLYPEMELPFVGSVYNLSREPVHLILKPMLPDLLRMLLTQ